MTRLISNFILIAALGIAGCNSEPTHESMAEETAQTLEDLTATLTSITDEASANAAKGKLKELAARFRELQQQKKNLGDASQEKEDELKKKYEDRLTKATKGMLTESTRIRANPTISSVLDEMNLNEPASQ